MSGQILRNGRLYRTPNRASVCDAPATRRGIRSGGPGEIQGRQIGFKHDPKASAVRARQTPSPVVQSIAAMQAESLRAVLIDYRYWVLVPLSLVEGPGVAFIAGTLASRGYFNLFGVFGLLVAKDMLVDGAYYALGRAAATEPFVARLLTKVRVTPEKIERVRLLWHRRGWRTMFVGKLSWGLSPAVLAAAGLIKLPAVAFFRLAVGVALLQYAVLLILGYSVGATFGAVSTAVALVPYIAAVAALAYARRRLGT